MCFLLRLPNELTFNIVSRLGIQDVRDLSRTCRDLYHYCQSQAVSKYFVQAEVRFSSEFKQTSCSAETVVPVLRRITKKREALSEAQPFQVAILALGEFYLYRHKWLWYVLGNNVRGLQIDSAPTTELVVNYRELLKRSAFSARGYRDGSFSLLHYQDGILSCLYRFALQEHREHPGSTSEDSDYEEREPDQPGWLIVLDVTKGTSVFQKYLESTKSIFARHTARYLYYGFRELDHFGKRHRWTLEGYDLETRDSLGNCYYLQDIDGFELGSTVCFEIIDGFFYAVTNQSTYRAQEIDWSSFYHCIRFPVDNPCREKLEKTEERSMWRRQHREGPVDDRWSTLSIAPDESTGILTIIECRKELAKGQRIAYKTNVVFPGQQPEPEIKPGPAAPPKPSKTITRFKIGGGTPQDEKARRLELLSLTQDRVALTLEDHHTPRYLPPQKRLAANVHPEPADHTFTFSTTPLRSYNASASCFLDLVNDLPPHDPTVKQCLRLRSCTRRSSLPPKDENGIIQFSADDSMNYAYADSPISFWPPEQPASGQRNDALHQLHELLNPPQYRGPVTGTFDDTSLVYSVGKGTLKALVFANFDPAVRLPGLKRWDDFLKARNRLSQPHQGQYQVPKLKRQFDTTMSSIDSVVSTTHDESAAEDVSPQQRKKRKSPLTGLNPDSGAVRTTRITVDLTRSDDEEAGLFSIEPALYLSISQGFDFSAPKSSI